MEKDYFLAQLIFIQMCFHRAYKISKSFIILVVYLFFLTLFYKQDEPYSPSRPVSPPSTTQPSILPGLEKIAIPANLSEILASIKSCSQPSNNDNRNQEYDRTDMMLGQFQSKGIYKAKYIEKNQMSLCENLQQQEKHREGNEKSQNAKLKVNDLDMRTMSSEQLSVGVRSSVNDDETCFEYEKSVKKFRRNNHALESENKTGVPGDMDFRISKI